MKKFLFLGLVICVILFDSFSLKSNAKRDGAQLTPKSDLSERIQPKRNDFGVHKLQKSNAAVGLKLNEVQANETNLNEALIPYDIHINSIDDDFRNNTSFFDLEYNLYILD